MTEPAPIIEVCGLIHEYPGKRALHDISFAVPTGSVTALVGPNGAGKTTLLRCLAGLMAPFSGQIRVQDIDLLRSPRKCHRMMGFLPDFFGLYDNLSVAQSLRYFALAHKMDPETIPDRLMQVVRWLDLEDKLHAPVASLSRGMRQRLGIGQALIHDPKILLLDEPASGLDPAARHALARLFVELNQDGKTLLVSSHILAELQEYASHLLILENGRIRHPLIPLEPSGSEKTLCVRAIAFPPDIQTRLAALETVREARLSDSEIQIRFEGNAANQHELLKALLQMGLEVTEFYVKSQSVQEQYLKTMRETLSRKGEP